MSNELEIKYGVAQGSILGPLLFVIYVNDFPDCITKGRTHLYADDMAITIKASTQTELQMKLNQHYRMVNQK